VLQVILGVLSDEVDDRNLRPACVVQVRKAVPDAWTEMQESARWFFGHACITVSRPGHDAFEEAEYATYFRYVVQCSDEMNFRSTRVRKACINPTQHQGANETCCTFHVFR